MAERLRRGAAWLDAKPRTCLSGLVVLYLLIVIGQACWKLLWGDELITFYVSQQPGVAGVWRALAAGADPNPPLLHVLVKASTALLGVSAFAMRIPSVLSGLVAIVAIWWMLRRWVRPVFCLGGVLASMSTRGFDYSYDARSYALLMGFSMLSLALWIALADLRGGRLFAATCALALALAAGVSANYYGVLAFFPVAAGEAVRQYEGRRFRVGVWLALLVGAVPLWAYLPLIRHNMLEFTPHAWNRTQVSMIWESYLLLVEGVTWPVLGLAAFAFLRRRGRKPLLTDAEWVALGVLLAYPVLGYAVARGGAGIISARCVVPVCCGFGLLAGVLMEQIARQERGSSQAKSFTAATTMLLLTTTFCAWFLVREGVCAAILGEQRHAFFRLAKNIEKVSMGPLPVADSSFVLPLFFYGDQSMKNRIIFPVDFAAIHRFERDDSGEENLWAGRAGVFPFPVVPLAQMQTPAWMVGRPQGWLAETMQASGKTVSGVEGQEAGWGADWDRVGGVFTPMAHPESRLLRVLPKQ